MRTITAILLNVSLVLLIFSPVIAGEADTTLVIKIEGMT